MRPIWSLRSEVKSIVQEELLATGASSASQPRPQSRPGPKRGANRARTPPASPHMSHQGSSSHERPDAAGTRDMHGDKVQLPMAVLGGFGTLTKRKIIEEVGNNFVDAVISNSMAPHPTQLFAPDIRSPVGLLRLRTVDDMWEFVAASKRLSTPFQFQGQNLYCDPSRTPEQRANTRKIRAAQEIVQKAVGEQEVEVQYRRGREAIWVGESKVLCRNPVTDTLVISTDALKRVRLSDAEALRVTETMAQALAADHGQRA